MERFGRYLLHECLGAGGMAAVHRATLDIGDGIIREVALKRLLPQLADDKKLVDDFIREARIAAQLHHPNIVRILELGRSQGVYFIAMELVSGQSLLQLMKLSILARQPAPIGVVVSLLVELCEALDYASNANDTEGEPLHIVHRDLSPSNLIVTEEGHLKIIDFGVAKAMSGKFQTSSGAVKGKFGYMSIEALQGKQLDRRADIFSVGVVAWELITGRRLFKAPNEYEVVMQIQKGASEPPSVYNPEVPPELDEIVMRAVARSRDERWPNAAVMRRTLDSLRRTYRDGPAEVVAWMQQLLPARAREQVEEPPPYTASEVEDEPPSIVVTPMPAEPLAEILSSVAPPITSPVTTPIPLASFTLEHDHPFSDQPSASRHPLGASAPYNVRGDYVAVPSFFDAAGPHSEPEPLSHDQEIPENADFSITPFIANAPAEVQQLVTEHIDDASAFLDEDAPEEPALEATTFGSAFTEDNVMTPVELAPQLRTTNVVDSVAIESVESVTIDSPHELPTTLGELDPAVADLAEGSKRRSADRTGSISRPPSTLARRHRESRLRGEAPERPSTPLLDPEPVSATHDEPTTISKLPLDD